LILETNASALVEIMINLNKIAKENEQPKGLLIDASGEIVTIYSSSPLVYGQANLPCIVTDPGVQLLPLTIIKTLNNMRDRAITLKVDLNSVVITEGRNVVEEPQFNASVDSVSTRDTKPQWFGMDVSRLRKIKYATTDRYDLDVFWLHNGVFVASDKSRVAVYRPGVELDHGISFSIPNFAPGFISGDFVDMAVNDGLLWLGSNSYYISTTESYKPMPYQLATVADNRHYLNNVTVSQAELLRVLTIAKNNLSKSIPGINLRINNEEIYLRYSSSDGTGELFVPVVESQLEFDIDIKVSTNFLFEAVNNCEHSQVNVGVTEYGKMNLMYVLDYDVAHFLLPLI
jgi:hypothetical protein